MPFQARSKARVFALTFAAAAAAAVMTSGFAPEPAHANPSQVITAAIQSAVRDARDRVQDRMRADQPIRGKYAKSGAH